MKLKQKLTLALASAVMVTSIPVPIFAESTDISPATISLVEGDTVGYNVPPSDTFDEVRYLKASNTDEENQAVRKAAKNIGSETYFDRYGNEFVDIDTYDALIEGKGDHSGNTNVDSDNYRNLTNAEADDVITILEIYSPSGHLADKKKRQNVS